MLKSVIKPNNNIFKTKAWNIQKENSEPCTIFQSFSKNYELETIITFDKLIGRISIPGLDMTLTLIVPSANSVSPLKIAIANRLIHATQKNFIVYLFL